MMLPVFLSRPALWLGATALLASLAGVAHAQTPAVVASIKPVHSLVAAVMEGVGEPQLLLDSNVSPHTYALRPSDARALAGADLVVWIGGGVESFLPGPLETLAGEADVLELSDAEGLTLLPMREGGMFEPHAHGDDDHDHHHHDHSHGEHDAHVWLDPANAVVMVGAIANRLARIDPANAERYRANAEAQTQRLETLDSDLAAMLEPVAGRPFIVFHDAFQYLENAYGVSTVASVTVNPEVAPGARRIAELQQRVADLSVNCLIREPQFPSEMVDLLATETTRTAVLDPIGVDIEAGPDLYGQLMRTNAQALAACLADPT